MARRLFTIALGILRLAASLAHDPAIVSAPYPGSPPQPDPPSVATEYHDCGGTQAGDLSVNIRDAGLRRVHSDFVDSASVTRLDLGGNEIAEVAPGAFRFLPNLLWLNLSRNELPLAELARLEGHPRLCALIVDGNNASGAAGAAVEFAGEFPGLRHLHLGGNGIRNLGALGFAPRLETLRLAGNALGEGDLGFLEGAPATLRSLDLAENGIRGLKLRGLASLRELVLSGNLVESLCGDGCDDGEAALELGGAGALERLVLARNALRSIEAGAFNETEGLLELDLSHNRLEAIPAGTFEPLQELGSLSLRGNLLAEVPHLCGPDSLLSLSLADNQIEAVRNDSFCVMEKLRLVDLSRNRIRSVEPEAFEMLEYLEVLDLSYNRLTRFAEYWLKPLGRLKTLIADGNRFESLQDVELDRIYGGYSALENVYLRNNSIDRVDSRVLYGVLKRNPRITIELFTDGHADGSDNENEIEECKCDCDDNQV